VQRLDFQTASTVIAREHTSAFPRQQRARGMLRTIAFPGSEGVRNAGRPGHPQPRMQNRKAYERSHHEYPGKPGVPHAMVLTASFVLSPVSRALLQPSPAVCLRQLDTGVRVSGPHDFSVRGQHHSSAIIDRVTQPASIASHPASVTIAIRPCFGAGQGRIYR
jgi:hypothetical protein